MTTFLSRAAVVALGTGLFAAALLAQDQKPVDKADTGVGLIGGYTIVSGERDGKAIDPSHVQGATVRFTGDEVIGTDKDRKQLFVAKYELSTRSTPWKITMTSTAPASGNASGLVEKKGDTLRVVYNLPGGAAPTEFKAGEKQHLFVLKAIPASEAPNKK